MIDFETATKEYNGRLLNGLDFVDETSTEFKTRLVDVRRTFNLLDSQLSLEDVFIRLRRSKKIRQDSIFALKETPLLLKLIEMIYPDMPKETEERFRSWVVKRGLND